jgi:hypothetical protein
LILRYRSSSCEEFLLAPIHPPDRLLRSFTPQVARSPKRVSFPGGGVSKCCPAQIHSSDTSTSFFRWHNQKANRQIRIVIDSIHRCHLFHLNHSQINNIHTTFQYMASSTSTDTSRCQCTLVVAAVEHSLAATAMYGMCVYNMKSRGLCGQPSNGS